MFHDRQDNSAERDGRRRDDGDDAERELWNRGERDERGVGEDGESDAGCTVKRQQIAQAHRGGFDCCLSLAGNPQGLKPDLFSIVSGRD